MPAHMGRNSLKQVTKYLKLRLTRRRFQIANVVDEMTSNVGRVVDTIRERR